MSKGNIITFDAKVLNELKALRNDVEQIKSKRGAMSTTNLLLIICIVFSFFAGGTTIYFLIGSNDENNCPPCHPVSIVDVFDSATDPIDRGDRLVEQWRKIQQKFNNSK